MNSDDEFSDSMAQFSDSMAQFRFYEDYGIPQPVSWLVPKYIPAKGVTILSGSPGSGKSFVTEELISAALNQRKLFGSIDINGNGRPIVLVDQENDHSTLYERLEKLGGIPAKKLLVFSFDGNFDMQDEDLTDALQHKILDLNPSIVIFDTLRRTYSGDENNSELMNRIYKNVLKPIGNRTCCLLVAHTRKSGGLKVAVDEISEIRGTGDIAGLASAVFMLRKNATGSISIRPLKMRPSKLPEPLTVSVTETSGKLIFSTLENPAEELSTAETIADSLFEWLKNNIKTMAEVRSKDMLSAMHRYAERNTYSAIRLLKNRFVLKHIGWGRYQFVYSDSSLDDSVS